MIGNIWTVKNVAEIDRQQVVLKDKSRSKEEQFGGFLESQFSRPPFVPTIRNKVSDPDQNPASPCLRLGNRSRRQDVGDISWVKNLSQVKTSRFVAK